MKFSILLLVNDGYGEIMNGLGEDIWYVLVDSQSYGPYASDIMASFVREGRIISTSLISRHPQQGFIPAATVPIFQNWSRVTMQALAQPQAKAQIQTHGHSRHQQPATPAPQTTQSIKETLFIVMAEVDPKTGMNFLRALQNFGYVQRIGDSVWLLHASHNLSDVKAALSETLTKRDRLFIHDCFANQQGWENIGADLDGRIRDIWQRLKR